MRNFYRNSKISSHQPQNTTFPIQLVLPTYRRKHVLSRSFHYRFFARQSVDKTSLISYSLLKPFFTFVFPLVVFLPSVNLSYRRLLRLYHGTISSDAEIRENNKVFFSSPICCSISKISPPAWMLSSLWRIPFAGIWNDFCIKEVGSVPSEGLSSLRYLAMNRKDQDTEVWLPSILSLM